MTAPYIDDSATAPVERYFNEFGHDLFARENQKDPFLPAARYQWHTELTVPRFSRLFFQQESDPIDSETTFIVTFPSPATIEENTHTVYVDAIGYDLTKNVISFHDCIVAAGSQDEPETRYARITTPAGHDVTDQKQYFIDGWLLESAVKVSDVNTNWHNRVGAVVPTINASAVENNFFGKDLSQQLDELFETEGEEYFEPGMDSRFSTSLQDLCGYNPSSVLASLKHRIAEGEDGRNITAEAVQWASRQEAKVVRQLVLELLYVALRHHSSLVRDSAAFGLSYLEERQALGPLREALDRENVPELREDLKDLIQTLER